MQNYLKIAIILILSVSAFGQVTPGVISFNAGEVSPMLELRSDFEKYNNACRTLENMLILTQGPVFRRPGTKYIAEVGDANNEVRLIPFEYSKTDTYILEFGRQYMRVFRNGGQVLDDSNDPYEISTCFEEDELFDIQYVQSDNTMYLVDGNDPPQKLIRYDHDLWTLEDVDFETGPFLDENESDTEVYTSAISGDVHLYATIPDYNMVLLLNFNGDDAATSTTDESLSEHTISFSGDAQLDTAQKKFGTASLLGDGAGDYIYAADHSDWYFGEDDFTIEFWARWDGDPNTTGFMGQTEGSGSNLKWMIRWGAWGDNFSFHFQNPAGTSKYVHFEWTPSADTWYHLALVRDGSSWYFFVDGTQTGGTQTDATAIPDVMAQLKIMYDGETYYFKGWMDGLRISKDIARWTTDFTVTTTEYVLNDPNATLFDELHVGALWKIGHRRQETTLNGVIDANESSSTLECGGDYDYNIQGTWTGTVTLERSFDDEATWEAVYTRYNNNSAINEDYSDTETEDNVTYRITGSDFSAGSATYNFSVHDYTAYGIVKITSYVDTNEVIATVLSDLEDTGSTGKWSEGAWSDYRGWPQTIELHEQRLMFGGSYGYPQTIWASKTASGQSDDYENMTAGEDDDDALIYILPGQNPIQWMLSQTYLLIGTLSGVGRWGSSDDDTPITPTQPTNYRTQARYGSEYIQAVLVGDAILYVERGGQRVREFAYSLERDRFTAPDMTVLAEHITGDGIYNIAYQSRPDSVLWCVREDGNMPVLTYQREQDVVGWSLITTDGEFESVAVIPSTGEDEVWVVVKRTIDSNDVRYIEQFQPRDWGTNQDDCFFVDSGLSWDGGDAVNITDVNQADPALVTVETWPADGDGTNLGDGDQIKILSVSGMTELNGNIYTIDDSNVTDKTFTLNDYTDVNDVNSVGYTAYENGGTVQRFERDFSNLDHLEGETLAVLADGVTQGTETVSGGAITIDTWTNKVHVGLPYKSILETMPFVFNTEKGITAGSQFQISSIKINFYDSMDVSYGIDADNLEDVNFDSTTLYSGWEALDFLFGGDEPIVYLETENPLPVCVRAIVTKLNITER